MTNISLIFCLILLSLFKDSLFVILFAPIVRIYSSLKAKTSKATATIPISDIPKPIDHNLRLRIAVLISGFTRYYVFKVGYIPSHHFRNFIYRNVLLLGIKNSKYVTIYSRLEVREPNKIKIGDGTIIGDNVILDGRNGIIIGDNVNFSSNVSIWTEQHDHRDPFFRCETQQKQPVVIGNRVWLGPNTIILHSVKIGEGAVVAAGAVVTKDVEPYTIVAGIPARKIGDRNKNLKYVADGVYLPFL